MNTANLQLEGLYAAVACLVDLLANKNVLSRTEVDRTLQELEASLAADPNRPTELSDAHLDAICFPVRLLRLANETGARGEAFSFSRLAAEVGRSKPQH